MKLVVAHKHCPTTIIIYFTTLTLLLPVLLPNQPVSLIHANAQSSREQQQRRASEIGDEEELLPSAATTLEGNDDQFQSEMSSSTAQTDNPLMTSSSSSLSSSNTSSEQQLMSLQQQQQQPDYQLTTQQLFTLSRKFQLICCMGGIPQLTHPQLVRNFTFQSVQYVMNRDDAADIGDPSKNVAYLDTSSSGQGCRLFKGSFLLPKPSMLFGLSLELSYAAHVVCKCPEQGMGHTLDRQCRRLPNCQNNGFRLLDPRRCFCLEPFFGDRCEKLCDRGRRMRGSDGRDYCQCAPFFHGDECRDAVCLNGGRPSPIAEGVNCECPPHFIGFHCEIDANRTQPVTNRHEFGGTGSNRFHQRFGQEGGGEMFTRDVSGTVFSMVMIVVLVLSMYLLMKHRMQVQSRYLSTRRADLLGACNFPPPPSMHVSTMTGSSSGGMLPSQTRNVELLPITSEHQQQQSMGTMARSAISPFVRSLAPFFATDGGPPPYAPPGQRTRRSRNEVLPPLPTYEDATKLPTIRTATIIVEHDQQQPMAREDNDISPPPFFEEQQQSENQNEHAIGTPIERIEPEDGEGAREAALVEVPLINEERRTHQTATEQIATNNHQHGAMG